MALHPPLAELAQQLRVDSVRASEGIRARVLDLYTIKPIDAQALIGAAAETSVITVEDHWPESGLGDAVLAALAEVDQGPPVEKLAVRGMPTSGTPGELLHAAEIDGEAIVAAARRLSGAAAPTGGALW